MASIAPSVTAVSERRRNRPDLILLAAVIGMSGFGLLMIYSATRFGLERTDQISTFSMERQMIFVTAGLIAVYVFSIIDYREYRDVLPIVYGVTLVLLVLVFFFDPVKGAQRWIPMGFLNLQPAEFAKLAVILTSAYVLSRVPEEEPLSWSLLVRSGLLVALPTFMIFLQPDLGTAVVFPFVWLGMCFVAGMTWKQVAMLGFGGIGLAGAVWRLGLLAGHQIERIRVFLNPSLDPQGIGYNLRQSKLAIGSGQLLGKGLFEGTQTNFSYVPEQETDFIFTAVGEQVGFIGGVLVLAGFLIIVWRLLVIAATARDRFGTLLAVGIAGTIMFHTFINIGMTIGIAPVTGLPLPFLSQGGSFYLAMAIGIGVANSVWLRRTPYPGDR